MKRTLVLFFLFSIFLPLHASQGEEISDQMEKLNWLVGDWAITYNEESSGGAYFIDKGVRTCEFLAERKIVQCETFLERFEAEGHYTKPPLTRTSVYFLSYNPEKEKFMQIFFPAGKEPGVNYLDYDDEKQELSLSKPWVHTTLGIESILSISIRKTSGDSFMGVEKLEGTNDPYKEQTILKAKRIN